ncbi:MAG: hypothetical protein J6V25_10710 [Oscillospiraceae bacterium]|nr:hypothetical protein [Oscillospiraceae bacterium]
MKNFIFPMNLQLFAEGGAAAGEGGAEGTGATTPAAGVTTKGAQSNPLAAVKYGKQESAPAAEVQTEPAADPQPDVDIHAEFEKMIKGDYKEAYDKRVQDTVQKRLKGAKETEERLTAMNPLLDILSARYGVEASDTAALIKALEADDSFFEQAAMEQNMDTKQYRQMMLLQRENARLKNQNAEQAKQEQLNRQYAVWEQQAAEAKNLYPNLDLNVESQNPQFRQLLFAGVDVGTAYMVIHKDDVMASAMQHTAKTVEQKLANKIAAGNSRPAENGTSGQSAAIIKDDPSKWTRADREEVRRRVARGEKISL